MLMARKYNVQFLEYIKTIHKIFWEEKPLLLPKFQEPGRHKKGIIGIWIKVVVGIASELYHLF